MSRPSPRAGSRRRIRSGGPWEARIGYSRAVRVGEMVFVSGTTAARPDGRIAAPRDAGRQARVALGTIGRALHAAGSSFEDVVRVRYFLTDIQDAEGVVAAHRERFARVRPAATMVAVTRLLHPDMRVEVEADSVVSAATPRRSARAPSRRRRSRSRRRAPS